MSDTPTAEVKSKKPSLAVIVVGGGLVALNAMVAGGVMATMKRMEAEMARQAEAAAMAAIPVVEEEHEEDSDEVVEVELSEAHPEGPEEEMPVGAGAGHGAEAADELGQPDMSRRLLGETLLRMDARGATPGGLALILADHGDLDRQLAEAPQSSEPFEEVLSVGDDRLELKVEGPDGRPQVTLRAKARASAVLGSLASHLGLKLELSPALPPYLTGHPLVVEIRDRPLRRVVAALERALDVSLIVGKESLEVLPGPSSPSVLRERAFESYRWVLEDYARTPAASRVYLSIAVLRQEQEDFPGMIEALRELIMIWPESRAAAVARLRLGRTLLSTEGSQARRFLFELLGDSLAPTTERAEAGLLIGRSYLDQGDLVGALRSLEYARDLAEASDPEFAERAKAYLTLVLLREGELPAAVEAATELRAAVDDEARRIAAEVEARAQLALGRPNMAARAASMWVSHSIPKKRSRALGVLGHSLHAAGRSISALAVYKLSRLEGNYREWSSALPEAKLLTEIGRWTEAQRLLKNALESALEGSDLSRQLELRLELARVTLKVDGPSSAKPIIASVALDPQTHPDLRAKAYEMLATLALAREDAQEALDLYTALASDSLAPMSARRKALDARFSLLRDIGQEGDALLAARGIVWRGAR